MGHAFAQALFNWTPCERRVRRLQARIVKATKAGFALKSGAS